MRHTRFIAAVILTASLVLPGLSGVSAQADVKPHRHFVYAKIVTLPAGTLSFRAQVANYPTGYIALMKKNCLTCAWYRDRLRKTTPFGRIFLPVTAPLTGRWYWRYRTPETPNFAVTYSSTWYTFRH